MTDSRYVVWSRTSDRSRLDDEATGGAAGNDDIIAGALKRIAIVEDFQHLTINKRWAESSTWSMTLPFKEFKDKWGIADNARSMISDGYGLLGILVFSGVGSWPTTTDYTTYSDGDLVLSGVATNITRNWNGFTDTVTLSGESDTFFLKTRLTWPDPTHSFWATGLDYYDGVRDYTPTWWSDVAGSHSNADWQMGYAGRTTDPRDTIETVARGFVRDCLGTGAMDYAGRRLRFLYHGDNNARGDVVSYWSRFERIYDVIQKIIKMHNSDNIKLPTTKWVVGDDTKIPYFGFDIVQVSDTAVGPSIDWLPTAKTDCRLLFRFLTPRDMSEQVVFGTDLGDVSSYVFEERAPDYNKLFVDGCDWDTDKVPYATSQDHNYRMYSGWPPNTATEVSCGQYGRIEGFEAVSNDDKLVLPLNTTVTTTAAALQKNIVVASTVGFLPTGIITITDSLNTETCTIDSVNAGTNTLTVTGTGAGGTLAHTYTEARGAMVGAGKRVKESWDYCTRKLIDHLTNMARKSIKEKALNIATTITLTETEHKRFLENFRVGDYVTVRLGDQEVEEFLREVTLDVSIAGETITATVSDPWRFYWNRGTAPKILRDTEVRIDNIMRFVR